MRKSGSKVMLLILVFAIMMMFSVSVEVIGSGKASAAESDFSGGNGTSGSPFLIGNADQLARIGSDRYVDRGYYFKQIADIDLSSYGNWTPIGSTDIPMGRRFVGHLDGNGFRITGLTISGGVYVGLFSEISGDTYSPSSITNVRLENVNVTGDYYVGGLVGWSSGTINNSVVTGIVRGNNYVGGLVGWSDGAINNSYASGSVIGSHYHTGGLVGTLGYNSTINNSYASGNVIGGTCCSGGLVGIHYSGTISNSYATGNVSGDREVGGLIGIVDGGTTSNSYATGSVRGNSYVGGLIGRWTRGSINNSYYDIESTGQPTSAGGTGKSTAQMQNRSTYEEEIANKWDFTNIWVIDPSLNNGYPYLRAMISVEVSFDSNGGSAVASQTVNFNGTANEPSIPTKNGYKFEGWYSDSGLTQAFLFTTQITSDITLYAKWISTNNNLSGLALSSGMLSPAFASGTTNYSASVGYSDNSLMVTPWTADSAATVKVNGTLVTSGMPSSAISLNVGSNTITVEVTAQDGRTQTYMVTVTRAAISTNANLSNLTLSSGTLTPTFASGTTSYTVSVGNEVASLTVTPTVADSTATVKVNGSPVTSGSASGSVPLSLGANTITVLVTAEDGTPKTYTITVTRAKSSNADLSGLTLSSGVLSPSFSSGTLSYTTSVGNEVSGLTITPTVADSTATVKVDGTAVKSGTASGSVPLSVGPNTITVLVTVQDGTPKTYTITVTRAQSSIADLSGLALSSGALSPAFSSGTLSYTAIVGNEVSVLTITPTLADSTATVNVNGTAVMSGKASGSVPLSVGANTITVLVTAEDGTPKTYTITVTRAKSSNADLNGLTLSNGTLDPGFASGTTSYTASVGNAVTGVEITPTLADNTATVKVNGAAVNSGTASAAVSLNVGGNNKIIVEVIAEDGTTTQIYTIMVQRAAPVSPSTPNPTKPVTDSSNKPNNEIIIDENLAKITERQVDRRSIVSVELDGLEIAEELRKKGKGMHIVIPVTTVSDAVIVQLNGQLAQNMNAQSAVIELRTATASYVLSANQINMNEIAMQFGAGTAFEDINIEIEISNGALTQREQFEQYVKQSNVTLIVRPVEFTIRITAHNQKINASKFSAYIEMDIVIPNDVDPTKITTGVIFDGRGIYHVPTYLYRSNGNFIARINSLTNGLYSLIWNPKEFQDVERHWAKDAINDLGARMIVKGVDEKTFNPDDSVTRSEFTAIVIRALGLVPEGKTDRFSDVSMDHWANGTINKAVEYGIISGYGDKMFRPSATITREEAMVIIARALKIIGLDTQVSEQSLSETLGRFVDHDAIHEWAVKAVTTVVDAGIVSGIENEKLMPGKSITRAETVVIVQRMLQKANLIH